MTARFRDVPIRRKLVLMTLASSAIALLLAGGGFFAWDILQYQRTIQQDLTAQARIIGENSTAPLSFGDSTAAGETLAVLELQPNVEMACIYTMDGQLFATYYREARGMCPSAPSGAVGRGGTTRLVTAVMLQNRPIGTLLIERGLDDVRERLLIGGSILGGLFIFATLVAVVVGWRMQRTVVDPLLRLADAARAVSETSDYSGRAVAVSDDEIGVVVNAFNRMLDRVQARTTELQERTQQLSQANRVKDEFLATLSHELRTPLNAVLGWVRILRSTNVSPQTQARALETIERNARLQTNLVEDLLEVSRIESGKMHLEARPSDLAKIVDSAVEVVQPAAAAKQIRLATDVRRPAMTMGDPDRLQQVVWNLLFNAVKFTPAGGEVRVRLSTNGGHTLTVSDTGAGIDPSFLPHVFQPFRQADSSPTREHGGLGLGLTIVRHLVELHGGTVRAFSEGPGRGSTFEVTLPSTLVQDDGITIPQAVSAPPAPARIQADLLAGVAVLVVEDEEDARELLRTALERYGARVTAAGSAAEAMRVFDRTEPDVIVSDIGMPHEDGYSLVRRIRARPSATGGHVPAVALTAYASAADRERALSAGFQAHVAKPFEPAEVAALVHRLASSRSRA
jgi:signal transduction histidine kinase/CheY-like chemotaxis protein